MNEETPQYLCSTAVINYDHAAVAEFAKRSAGDVTDLREQAVRFYYAVRDGIRYDPYTIELSDEGLRASTTLASGRAWCVPKAVLLAACCRAAGIPARLGFADVRNHLSTARMRERMKTDLFFWHAYTSIRLGGVWVKATPAFNIGLCERLGLKPLDFDGRQDALFQPFDSAGNRQMEYVRYRGEFADVPISQIVATFRREYGALPSAKEGESILGGCG
ncbi:MAG TPA: transglutaminase family protein [Vicinamibacterales bacterium]|nr:transglutaminase [Acidobacteriota bacterium]HJO37911.1 transglutaminase family protein [Vicinamibacterales bacterium]